MKTLIDCAIAVVVFGGLVVAVFLFAIGIRGMRELAKIVFRKDREK
jgi:hypothetical protein